MGISPGSGETCGVLPDIWGRKPNEEAALNSDAKQTIEFLFRTHADRVLRYAQRRVPGHDAEEVVAQTFLIAWRRASDVPVDPLPWLIGIARNVIRNLERSGRRRIRLESHIASREPRDAHRRNPDEGIAGRVANALESLGPEDRELLMLVAWDELDHAATAKVMGWSQANLRLRLHRARKRMRRRLEETGYPFPRPTTQVTTTPEEAR